MTRVTTGIILVGSCMLGTNSFAVEPDNPRITKRQEIEQMIGCVKKRVATRFVSYSEAIRACKEEAEDPQPKTLTAADSSVRR